MRPNRWKRTLIALAVILTGGLATASEMVGVPGSSNRYATPIEVQVSGKAVRLVLTGTALRKRAIFSVYTVASYLQDGVKVQNAEQLVAAEGVKVLHLIMERDVEGKDMADAIRTGLKLNHPADAFAAELGKFETLLKSQNLTKGQHILLTAIPKVGFRCQVPGKADVVIESTGFARAIWEIYLGRNNLGEPIKAGLTSRL
jgi:hypothetical protein